MKKLFKAVRQNDLETVKMILDATPELINCVATPPPKKDDGQSLLQVANKVGSLKIAHYLIDRGIDVNYMEPDHGLHWSECFTCPVLIDAVRFLLSGGSEWKEYAEERMKLITHLLEKGADPNKTDNGNRNAWDWAIQAYLDAMDSIKDAEQQKLFTNLAKELFGNLYQYNADILNLDRVKNELKSYQSYSLLLENLILNRDYSFGVAPDRLERWNKSWLPVIPVIKSFYMRNNPNYENDK
ncbi:MAG: ankyrin repeat domain-containing protein [Lachnospiraceae bacterium]|nr:ankyrin repeat domain-containing protein [Lachnospiraceae bacterium]